MAQNITLLGASYSAVPAVTLPTTGGGTSSFYDVTETTATAADVAQGRYFFTSDGVLTAGTASAGSMVVRDEADSHGGTVRYITSGSVVQGTLEVTENGTYDVTAYADVDVDVAATAPRLQAKTATPSVSTQTISPDSGYDGLSQVTVSAMPSGSASTPATSITANPSISVNSSTGLITASVSGSKSVTPSVSAGYVSSGTAGTVSVSGSNTSQLTTQAAKTVTPSTSQQTAVAAGRYTTGAVTVAAMPSGTAGTPTATKGTVSNHAVSVTPSVTNSAGYISGGTKSGTAVSVSASELVSGTLSITENGTADVTNYASVTVDVSSGGGGGYTLGEFTVNGTVGSSFLYKLGFIDCIVNNDRPITLPRNVKNGTSLNSTGHWFVSDDGFMYVTFISNSTKATPSVTATSGTAAHVLTFDFNTAVLGSYACQDCGRVYKMTPGAVVTLSYTDLS